MGYAGETKLPFDKRLIEKATRLLALSNTDLGRLASGGYGRDRQLMFQNDLRDALEVFVADTKPKGIWGA